MTEAGLIATYADMLEDELVEEICDKLLPQSQKNDLEKRQEVEKIVQSAVGSFNEHWFTVQLPKILDSTQPAESWRKAMELRRG